MNHHHRYCLRHLKPPPRNPKIARLHRSVNGYLQESFPDHVVNKWLGHSGKVAEKHYLQTTDEHWGKANEFGTPISCNQGGNPFHHENTKPNDLQGSDGCGLPLKAHLMPPQGLEPWTR